MTTPRPEWPFTEWHRMAVRHLHLSPTDFWDMPLRLWLSLLSPTHAPLDRAALLDLMKDYPDEH